MSSIAFGAKRLFFVQNGFQAALNIPIVFKGGAALCIRDEGIYEDDFRNSIRYTFMI